MTHRLILAASLVTLAACTTAGTPAFVERAGDVSLSRDASTLRGAMRDLWTDHVIWTRAYIVAAVADDPSAQAAANRLMKNQEQIGAAVVPYYGGAAGSQLTALLKDHITIAVDLVAASKTGDNAKLADADRCWHANSAEIATFLSAANPNWPRETLRVMLDEHLRLTTEQARARIQKRWDDDVRTFDEILDQAVHMADALTDGIVKQFPSRF